MEHIHLDILRNVVRLLFNQILSQNLQNHITINIQFHKIISYILTQNIDTRIKLNGATKLTGAWINNGIPIPATIAQSLGENIFIIAAFTEHHLKMVKIRVTGRTTFIWMEAKYSNPSSNSSCKLQETFSENCFIGTSVPEENYTVQLVAILGAGNMSVITIFSPELYYENLQSTY